MLGLNYLISFIIAAFVILSSIIFIIIGWWLTLLPLRLRIKIADLFLVQPLAAIFNLLFCMRLKIINKQYVDKKRTTLYICNHQSWLDIPTFIKYSHCISVSKKEVLKMPVIGFLAIMAGAYFIDRDKSRDRIGIIKNLMKHFKSDLSLCLFPEGTRNENGQLLSPQFSIIRLCYKLNIPVVPASIEGTKSVLRKKRLYYRLFQKVILQYTPPLYPRDYENETEFCNACWNKVIETHRQILENHF